jgi:magnesium transporter
VNDEATGGIGESSVQWHDIRDPQDPELDRLAAMYHLHPLHIEDCRHRNQRAKAEEHGGYIFIVLKPVVCLPGQVLSLTDLDIFVGEDFVITVRGGECPEVDEMLGRLRASWGTWTRGDELLHHILDGVVDAYLPTLDQYSDLIGELEDAVIQNPGPEALQSLLNARRGLIQLRRVLANTRDVVGYLQRTGSELISSDLWPFLRDVYDHVTRYLEIVEMERELINGAVDIYLSSVSNRINSTMKALAVIGTLVLPAILIASVYGMNVDGLPWAHERYGFALVISIVLLLMAALLLILRRKKWL